MPEKSKTETPKTESKTPAQRKAEREHSPDELKFVCDMKDERSGKPCGAKWPTARSLATHKNFKHLRKRLNARDIMKAA